MATRESAYDAYWHALKDYGRATAEYYVNLSVQQAAGEQFDPFEIADMTKQVMNEFDKELAKEKAVAAAAPKVGLARSIIGSIWHDTNGNTGWVDKHGNTRDYEP
jgi:hypothetical protein